MATRPHFVILGAGVAGHFAAEGLRKAGFDGRVTLLGAEPARPYDRPALSKAFLQGQKQPDDLPFRPDTFYAEHDIDLVLGEPATAVDLGARTVTLSSQQAIGFDKLLIATGSSPIRLRVPGVDLGGVHELRSLADARALRASIERAGRILVVGAGFIGCEVTASARALGRDVTLIDLLDAPLRGPLGQELAGMYTALHQSHGVDLRLGHHLVELRGGASGEVEEAVFENGERLACDLVVVGVGVRPNVSLFHDSPLAIDRGILVDEHCRTSVPDVFAAGDVAEWWHPELKRRFNVEHFDNAGMQGAAAAKAMAGQPEPYAPLPSFWTDQYDTTLQYYGYPLPWDQIVLRGNPEDFSATAFYLRDGRVIAGAMVNRSKEHRSVRRLVAAAAEIEPVVLASEETDLRALSRQLAGG